MYVNSGSEWWWSWSGEVEGGTGTRGGGDVGQDVPLRA